jgi:hypothetical protein
MLSQCANANCGKRLTSLSEGRVFQFEIVSISVSATDDEPASGQAFEEKPQRETAYFWLCGECAAGMTLTLEPRQGLQLVPIDSATRPPKEQLPREFHDC